MKITDLKPEHQDTLIGKLLTLKSKRNYYLKNTITFYNEMTKSEQKEYSELYEENESDIRILSSCIMEHQSIFNSILSNYNLSCVTFLAKEFTI